MIEPIIPSCNVSGELFTPEIHEKVVPIVYTVGAGSATKAIGCRVTGLAAASSLCVGVRWDETVGYDCIYVCTQGILYIHLYEVLEDQPSRDLTEGGRRRECHKPNDNIH